MLAVLYRLFVSFRSVPFSPYPTIQTPNDPLSICFPSHFPLARVLLHISLHFTINSSSSALDSHLPILRRIPRLDKCLLRAIGVVLRTDFLHPNFGPILGKHHVLLLQLVYAALGEGRGVEEDLMGTHQRR
jgi:hypothetical protein